MASDPNDIAAMRAAAAAARLEYISPSVSIISPVPIVSPSPPSISSGGGAMYELGGKMYTEAEIIAMPAPSQAAVGVATPQEAKALGVAPVQPGEYYVEIETRGGKIVQVPESQWTETMRVSAGRTGTVFGNLPEYKPEPEPLISRPSDMSMITGETMQRADQPPLTRLQAEARAEQERLRGLVTLGGILEPVAGEAVPISFAKGAIRTGTSLITAPLAMYGAARVTTAGMQYAPEETVAGFRRLGDPEFIKAGIIEPVITHIKTDPFGFVGEIAGGALIGYGLGKLAAKLGPAPKVGTITGAKILDLPGDEGEFGTQISAVAEKGAKGPPVESVVLTDYIRVPGGKVASFSQIIGTDVKGIAAGVSKTIEGTPAATLAYGKAVVEQPGIIAGLKRAIGIGGTKTTASSSKLLSWVRESIETPEVVKESVGIAGKGSVWELTKAGEVVGEAPANILGLMKTVKAKASGLGAGGAAGEGLVFGIETTPALATGFDIVSAAARVKVAGGGVSTVPVLAGLGLVAPSLVSKAAGGQVVVGLPSFITGGEPGKVTVSKAASTMDSIVGMPTTVQRAPSANIITGGLEAEFSRVGKLGPAFMPVVEPAEPMADVIGVEVEPVPITAVTPRPRVVRLTEEQRRIYGGMTGGEMKEARRRELTLRDLAGVMGTERRTGRALREVSALKMAFGGEQELEQKRRVEGLQKLGTRVQTGYDEFINLQLGITTPVQIQKRRTIFALGFPQIARTAELGPSWVAPGPRPPVTRPPTGGFDFGDITGLPGRRREAPGRRAKYEEKLWPGDIMRAIGGLPAPKRKRGRGGLFGGLEGLV